ncbi:MAG TPA: carboxypeptidase-like regulatory domain-containing protein [Gemmatimonadaceae bacterium]
MSDGPRLVRLAALVASLGCAAPLVAQQTSGGVGRVQGTIRETMRPRSVRDASITLARLDPEPTVSFGTKPDAKGHFQLDSLPVGRYMIQLNHQVLDSLELALPAEELFVVAGKTLEVPFALPSGAELREAVCRGLTLRRETGAVFGRVVDADNERPLANADVAITWTELAFDRKTLRANAEQHDASVRTGPRGEYRICNVPTGSWVLIQLQYAGHAGNAVRVSVSGEEAVIVRNLSMSVNSTPTLDALDSVGATVRGLDSEPTPDDTVPQLLLTGNATVSGIVRGAQGEPLPDVEIRVVNARPTTRTDAAGHYTLSGLPAGTQLLAVRRIGYLVGDIAVELRGGRMVRQDVVLRRVVSLDSMNVVAKQRKQFADFEYRRKNNPMGRFVTAGDIARYHPTEMGIFIQRLGGFQIVGVGPEAQVYSTSARAGRPNCREANVVIDGVDQAQVNTVSPNEIAAMEVYAEAASAPGQYRAECGLILIWTKKYGAMPPT